MALNLLAVTVNDSHVVNHAEPGTQLVVVRDLAAICSATEDRPLEPDEVRAAQHNKIVTAFGARGPVLPAPIGLAFRSADAVERWLELHYGALTGALTFVENRCAGRVHIWRNGTPEEREAGSDLATIAAESLRVLRRSAVATVPLRLEKVTGLVLSAAFLVEEELWKEFAEAVKEQGQKSPSVRFELTGPWPPYDFVQMQLGA